MSVQTKEMPKTEQARDVEVSSGTSSSEEEHEHVHGEHCNHSEDAKPNGKNMNVGAKQYRKMIDKMGLKPVTTVTRVTMRRGRNQLIVIASPQVFQAADGSYVVFGDVQTQDMSKPSSAPKFEMTPEIEKAALAELAKLDQQEASKSSTQKKINAQTEEEEEDTSKGASNVDESGLDDYDITTVMKQTNVSRSKAVAALRRNNGDLVNTIMELSIG